MAVGRTVPPTQDAIRERAIIKLGAVCAVVGAAGFLAAGGLHGDLPRDAEAAVRYLAARPYWSAVHLLAMVSALLWVPAFAGLASTLRGGMSWVLGRLAVAAVIIGVAVFIIDYSIDGYSLKFVADEWAATSGDSGKLLAADAVLGVLRGTVLSSLAWLFGLPFLVVGLAVVLDVGHSRWFGWIPLVTGGGCTLAGLAAYARVFPGSFTEPLFLAAIFLSFGSFIWLGASGVVMWRSAARLV